MRSCPSAFFWPSFLGPILLLLLPLTSGWHEHSTKILSSTFFFRYPHRINPDVEVEVRRSLHCPVQHCPHHGPGPLLPLLCPHSYTAQLPPLDPPEATTSVVRLSQFKPSMQWQGYKPTTAQSHLVERLNLSSRLIHAVMGI